MAIVARLLRGEPLELVAQQTNVSIARLSEWRERALAGAATALKERERDDRDHEIARLTSKVGEITMDNELLYTKIAASEGKRSWPAGGRTMSQTLSLSFARCYGLARVARVWKISRAGVYRSLKETQPNTSARRPDPSAHVRSGTGRSYSPQIDASRLHARLPQVWRDALAGVRQPPTCATVMPRRLLAPHRVLRTEPSRTMTIITTSQ